MLGVERTLRYPVDQVPPRIARQEILIELGREVPRGQSVNAYLVSGKSQRQLLSQLDQACFGSGIGRNVTRLSHYLCVRLV
jgi:hypothetical protein